MTYFVSSGTGNLWDHTVCLTVFMTRQRVASHVRLAETAVRSTVVTNSALDHAVIRVISVPSLAAGTVHITSVNWHAMSPVRGHRAISRVTTSCRVNIPVLDCVVNPAYRCVLFATARYVRLPVLHSTLI